MGTVLPCYNYSRGSWECDERFQQAILCGEAYGVVPPPSSFQDEYNDHQHCLPPPPPLPPIEIIHGPPGTGEYSLSLSLSLSLSFSRLTLLPPSLPSFQVKPTNAFNDYWLSLTTKLP
jgi:hypothetical protein